MLQHMVSPRTQNSNTPEHLKVGEYSFHTGHDVLQMLLFQASCNYTACLASALLRLICIFIVSASHHWRVPVAMIWLLAIAIQVAWPRKAILHTEIGCFAATGA